MCVTAPCTGRTSRRVCPRPTGTACSHRVVHTACQLAPAGGKEGRRAGVGKVGDKDAKFAATEILSQPGSWLAKMPPGEGNRKKFDLHLWRPATFCRLQVAALQEGREGAPSAAGKAVPIPVSAPTCGFFLTVILANIATSIPYGTPPPGRGTAATAELLHTLSLLFSFRVKHNLWSLCFRAFPGRRALGLNPVASTAA